MGLQLQQNEQGTAPEGAGPPPLPGQAPQPVVPNHRQPPPPALEPKDLGFGGKFVVWLLATVVMGGGAGLWNFLVDAGAYAYAEALVQANADQQDMYDDDEFWGDGSALDMSIPGGRNLPEGWPQLRFTGVFKSGSGDVAGIVIDDSLVSVHGSVQGVKVLDVKDGWALLEYKGQKRRMEVWGE